jgi:uncharacterized protein (TIGR00251 family)
VHRQYQPVRESEGGVWLAVQVQPQARRTEYAGIHGEVLKFKVAASPEGGKANEALCDYLAERLGVPGRAVAIRAGHASRQKQIFVRGVTADRVRQVFACAGPARLHQINISNGGVPKLPVAEARITTEGVAGDHQRSRLFHGGPDRAVCLFSLEVIQALQAEGHGIQPGSSGENLTVAGLNWRDVRPGVRLRIGSSVKLEVMSYTAPCKHNARWFRDGDFTRISQKHHPGWSRLYARVLAEGTVRPGDPVEIECAGEGTGS